MKFHTVVIIYNPNSTGPSKRNASELKRQLTTAGYEGVVKLLSTKFAGHAEEITRRWANDKGVLIISSSGDGGYNEVVNALLSTQGKAAVAVLPSGNANDHAVSLKTDHFIDHILQAKTKMIDSIKVISTVDGKPWIRYAHSYLGFGMTPSVGRLLTDQRPGVLLEKWYVLQHVFSFRHTALVRDGRRRRYSNLVVAIIPKMSKIIKLDETSSVTDGKMEVYETLYVSRFKVLFTLLGVGLNGIASEQITKRLELKTIRPTLIQLDGEVTRLDRDSIVTITCEHQSLRTVL